MKALYLIISIASFCNSMMSFWLHDFGEGCGGKLKIKAKNPACEIYEKKDGTK